METAKIYAHQLVGVPFSSIPSIRGGFLAGFAVFLIILYHKFWKSKGLFEEIILK